MASMTITIPDEKIEDAVEAFCVRYNYQESESNPESKNQFAKRKLLEHVQRVYQDYKLQELDANRTVLLEEAKTFTDDFS